MNEHPPQLDYARPDESEVVRRKAERDGRAIILLFCAFAAITAVLAAMCLIH